MKNKIIFMIILGLSHANYAGDRIPTSNLNTTSKDISQTGQSNECNINFSPCNVIGNSSATRNRLGEEKFTQALKDQQNNRDAVDKATVFRPENQVYTSGFREGALKSGAHDRGAVDLRTPYDADHLAKDISRNLGPSDRVTVINEMKDGIPLRDGSGWQRDDKYLNGKLFSVDFCDPMHPKIDKNGKEIPCHATANHFHIQPPINTKPKSIGNLKQHYSESLNQATPGMEQYLQADKNELMRASEEINNSLYSNFDSLLQEKIAKNRVKMAETRANAEQEQAAMRMEQQRDYDTSNIGSDLLDIVAPVVGVLGTQAIVNSHQRKATNYSGSDDTKISGHSEESDCYQTRDSDGKNCEGCCTGQ